ncbi:hypothetical protein Acr_00g0055230 [Actinidia rufa]|uniref:Uncharacterized protein n=1 Tax=Actinidia rufa TaxID=165716 RepID=A0A7J0DNV7_9ERIC|nr:hypothetical protein Acr_00g0055230 [Actinidia rufa]
MAATIEEVEVRAGAVGGVVEVDEASVTPKGASHQRGQGPQHGSEAENEDEKPINVHYSS